MKDQNIVVIAIAKVFTSKGSITSNAVCAATDFRFARLTQSISTSQIK